MKVVTWNMAYWSKKASHNSAWSFLLNVIKPDVALVQEVCLPTDETIKNKTVFKEIGGTRDWGSGVYSIYQSKAISFDNSYPGSLIGAKINLPSGKELGIFSLYGKLETKYGDKTAFATTTVHKMISDL
jgi:hypothetical protein